MNNLRLNPLFSKGSRACILTNRTGPGCSSILFMAQAQLVLESNRGIPFVVLAWRRIWENKGADAHADAFQGFYLAESHMGTCVSFCNNKKTSKRSSLYRRGPACSSTNMDFFNDGTISRKLRGVGHWKFVKLFVLLAQYHR